MSGWVLLNSLTIWLSRVRVLPDHMVCQVMLATVPVEEEDDEAEDEDDAAVPPQPAAATTVTAASTTADLPATVLRGFLDLLSVTSCSFLIDYGYSFMAHCNSWLTAKRAVARRFPARSARAAAGASRLGWRRSAPAARRRTPARGRRSPAGPWSGRG